MRLFDEVANWRPQARATGFRYSAGSAAMSYAGPPRCGELSVTIDGIEMPASMAACAYENAGAMVPAGAGCLSAATVARATSPP